VVQDEYVLPVDAEALGVLPHAHYLCKEMQGFATLPNGTRQPLLLIKQWDFNWQGDYQYAKPVPLSKGTRPRPRSIDPCRQRRSRLLEDAALTRRSWQR